MSSNNQLIIIENERTKKYDIYYDGCVDNDFEFKSEDLLKSFKSLKRAIRWANNYCIENMIEYGVRISV